MAEKIIPGLYRIEIPMIGNPLKALNSYVITGKERNLIVDTGLNMPECLQAMQRGLEELDINLNKTDFFITHCHADHYDLTPSLMTPESKIFISQEDADCTRNELFWVDADHYSLLNGYPPEMIRKSIRTNPNYDFVHLKPSETTILADNDTLVVGDFNFRCIKTPGHSPGHLCLYDQNKKLLISGDHILGSVSPNINTWSDITNPLRDYLSSLDKISMLDVALVLPAHRERLTNCNSRIAEIKLHHHERCEEILSILQTGDYTAFQIASRITWDMRGTWDAYPPTQQWFATGEALSHLKYLKDDGFVEAKILDGIRVFSLTH